MDLETLKYTEWFLITCIKYKDYVLLLKSSQEVPMNILVAVTLLVKTGRIRKSTETNIVLRSTFI
jgi:hypothetical protein